MNRKKLVLLIIIMVVCFSTYGVYLFLKDNKDDSLVATGTIEATSVDLMAKINGTIEKITIEEGSKVEAGQLVAKLQRQDLKAQRERDLQSVNLARAHLNELVSGPRVQEIETALANVSIAQANLEQAQSDFSRIETLFHEGAVSQDFFDKAQNSVTLKKNQLKIAESQLDLLKSGNHPESINAAIAEMERNKAVLKTTEALLNDLNIYAPFSGNVVSKNYEEGEFVNAGTPIVTIADLSDLWIKVYIPTDDLPRVALGQKVNLTVSGSNQVFNGEVSYIASKGEYTPKTIQTKKERTNVVFAVKIDIQEEGGILKPGMPADVVFSSEE